MPTNALLIKHENGWAERTTTASPERIEAMLSLGAVTSVTEVYRVADEVLREVKDKREQVSVGLSQAATTLPYGSYTNGDTVTVPLSDGSTSTERVQAVTVTEDDGSGEVGFTLTVKDIILEAQEAFELAVRKMDNGSMGGGAVTAQPAIPLYIPPAT